MTRPEVDRLFTLPLEQFVAERDALAKQLRAEGDKALAAEVKALKKPAAPAWALNQLARHDRPAFGSWLAAVDRLRDVQAALALGEADAAQMRKAIEAEREAIADLRGAADQLFGGDADRGLLDRIVRTFRAAAVDPETRATLEAGRLAIEQEEQGFDALAAALAGAELPKLSRDLALKKLEAPKAAPPKAPPPSSAVKPEPRAVERAAAGEAQLLERKIARTEAHLAQLEEQAERARAQVGLAKAERDRSARALAAAEEKLAKAEELLQAAELDRADVGRELAELIGHRR